MLAAKRAKGVSCFDCHRTESSQWIKHPDNELAYRCAACYKKARAGSKEAKGVSCLDCHRTESSQWIKHPDNELAYRCAACYKKAIRGIRGAEVRSESASLKRKRGVLEGNTIAVSRNPTISNSEVRLSGNSREESVVGETRLEVKEDKGVSCFDCHRMESFLWIKLPENELAHRCGACYRKARAASKKAKGVSCLDCHTIESSQWYKHPENELAHRCNACYQKARLAIRTTECQVDSRSLKRKRDVIDSFEADKRLAYRNRRISNRGVRSSVGSREESVFGEVRNQVYPSPVDRSEPFQGLEEQSLVAVVGQTVEVSSSSLTGVLAEVGVYSPEEISLLIDGSSGFRNFSQGEDPLAEMTIACV